MGFSIAGTDSVTIINPAINPSTHLLSLKTVATLHTFMLCMVLHPVVQKKAQEDIDRLTDRERLPDFSDRDALPYVDAIVNECLRLYPVFRLSMCLFLYHITDALISAKMFLIA